MKKRKMSGPLGGDFFDSHCRCYRMKVWWWWPSVMAANGRVQLKNIDKTEEVANRLPFFIGLLETCVPTRTLELFVCMRMMTRLYNGSVFFCPVIGGLLLLLLLHVFNKHALHARGSRSFTILLRGTRLFEIWQQETAVYVSVFSDLLELLLSQ